MVVATQFYDGPMHLDLDWVKRSSDPQPQKGTRLTAHVFPCDKIDHEPTEVCVCVCVCVYVCVCVCVCVMCKRVQKINTMFPLTCQSNIVVGDKQMKKKNFMFQVFLFCLFLVCGVCVLQLSSGGAAEDSIK